MSSGIFILSLDTEIAWGANSAEDLRRLAPCYYDNRLTAARLIALLDAYAIPATWAIVGHLLLDRCDGHPDLPQPYYAWANTPDSERDPRSDVDRAPWYYAPDLIAQVRAARVRHEIGTHSFTHVIADDPAVTRAMWAAQMATCAALHAERGLPMRSLVYPANRIAFLDSLPAFGIVAYRGREQRQPRPLGWATDRLLPFTPPTYALNTRIECIENASIVNLPASQYLLARRHRGRLLAPRVRVGDALRGLKQAAQRDELFHLWFHPHDLSLGDWTFTGLNRILREAAHLRDAGKLRILTMGETAAEILALAELGASQQAL